MHKYPFIVIDGTDGSGKTSVLNFLQAKLSELRIPFFVTEESTRDIFGLAIRGVIKNLGSVDPWALQMLFIADRVNHRRDIQQALRDGKMVVCDRYQYSGIAFGTYDICARLPNMDPVEIRNRLIAIHRQLPIPAPAAALVMSVPAALAVERITARNQEQFLDRFETVQAIEWVHREFEALAATGAFPEMRVIDNSGELTSTFTKVWQHVESLLP